MHVAEHLCHEKDLTLMTNETTKCGEKYMGYHISDKTQRHWVIGLRDLATKSAKDTINTFKQIIDDLDDICKGQNDSNAGKQLFSKYNE